MCFLPACLRSWLLRLPDRRSDSCPDLRYQRLGIPTCLVLPPFSTLPCGGVPTARHDGFVRAGRTARSGSASRRRLLPGSAGSRTVDGSVRGTGTPLRPRCAAPPRTPRPRGSWACRRLPAEGIGRIWACGVGWRSGAAVGSGRIFSRAELAADRVITRFITRSRRCPSLPSLGMAGDRALGAELVLRYGGQPSPDAAIAAGLLARARTELPVLDDIEPAPLRPCLRATRSDRPDRSAKPAGREALTAAPARARP